MKKKSLQPQFRKKVFDYNQYWQLSFTEKYEDGSELDFKTIIKAKSYYLAKKILKERVNEDDSKTKVKAIQGFMFHSGYKSQYGRKLTLERWNHIRNASFPNISNTLFKYPVPRPEWKSNRFNATNHEHLKTIGFKSGDENWSRIHRKGKFLAPHLKAGKIWTGGSWISWDKADMERIKNNIIAALIKHDNNRSKAAEEMGIHRNQMYKLMNRITGVNWQLEFPVTRKAPPPIPTKQRSEIQKKVMRKKMEQGFVPFSNLTEEDEAKRFKNMKASFKKAKESRFTKFVDQAKKALSQCNNSRKDAAKLLGISVNALSKSMTKTKHLIDWQSEFPSKYSRNQK